MFSLFLILTEITNLRSTSKPTSVFALWDRVTTSPNCKEDKDLYYRVSLLYPNGTRNVTNTTTNHMTFENLESNTNYVISVAAVSTTGVISPFQPLNVTTADSGIFSHNY